MHRRQFVSLLGSAAAWPLAARAQQRAAPVVGLLSVGTPDASRNDVQAFLKGLGQIGFVEGKNVTIEYRYAGGQFDPVPELVADLVRHQVAVIVTPLSVAAALAAKAATATTPIVFSTGVDPVQVGLVANLNRPGGNVTGILTMANEIGARRLGLLHELLPTAKRVGVLVNPGNRLVAEAITTDLRTAASTIALQVEILPASTVGEIDSAFASFVQQRLDALVVPADSFFGARQSQILTLATRHVIPAMWTSREAVVAGGLMGYSSDQGDVNRQVGLYAGRILKGEKPADLPVARPTKFEFTINLSTARALGIEVPATLLALADEVIE
jgi:putative tryptophan/tyrosine transport system substrate-binding protein